MSGFVLCGRSTTYRWEIGKCYGRCGIAGGVIVNHQGSPYYSTDFICTNCGDCWCIEGMGERPFGDRYWRHKAIASAEQMFERSCQCPVERDDDYYPLPCKHSGGLA